MSFNPELRAEHGLGPTNNNPETGKVQNICVAALTAQPYGNLAILAVPYPKLGKFGLPSNLRIPNETPSAAAIRTARQFIDPDRTINMERITQPVKLPKDYLPRKISKDLTLTGYLYRRPTYESIPGMMPLRLNSNYPNLLAGHKAVFEAAIAHAHNETEKDYLWPAPILTRYGEPFAAHALARFNSALRGYNVETQEIEEWLRIDPRVEIKRATTTTRQRSSTKLSGYVLSCNSPVNLDSID